MDAIEMHRQQPVRLLGWDDLRAKGIARFQANNLPARLKPVSFRNRSTPASLLLGLSMKSTRYLLSLIAQRDAGGCVMVTILKQTKFVWRGLDLHLGRRKTPVLTLVADATYPHLYRIRYPNGWASTPGNLTRAKDAAYGHARYLLGQETPSEAPQTGERRAA